VSEHRQKIVVVGGGITGLTAAFTLQKQCAKEKLSVEIVLVEATHRIGGKIETLTKENLLIERGPESFFDIDQVMRTLASDLQIEHKIIQHHEGETYIAVGNDMHKLPSSFLLGGSSEITGLMTSSLISLAGKARAAGDLFIRKSEQAIDEPISQFFKRRFGKEVVENLVEPLLAGTFAGDIDHLSMEAMFPQFIELEQKERSLIKGFLKNKQGFYNTDSTNHALFYETFEGGLNTLIQALENALDYVSIKKGVKVDSIERTSNETVKLYLNNAEVIEADGVIVTTPYNSAKSILRDVIAIDRAEPMKASSIATIYVAFDKEHITKYKDALNIFVSRNSNFTITTCTFVSRKWAQCPDHLELLRIYIGRVGDESVVELADQEIVKTILNDLEQMLGIKEQPQFSYVSRWKEGMPQYTIGHMNRTKLMKEELAKVFPNVLVCGSSYDGMSMPSCVKQGIDTAMELLEIVKKTAYNNL
jgi:protoporphyrinogen/coproporphyrinogen III oxidase